VCVCYEATTTRDPPAHICMPEKVPSASHLAVKLPVPEAERGGGMAQEVREGHSSYPKKKKTGEPHNLHKARAACVPVT